MKFNKIIVKAFKILAVVFFAFILLLNWAKYSVNEMHKKRGLQFEDTLIIRCHYSLVGCANENDNFVIVSVNNPEYDYIIKSNVNLWWSNPSYDSISKTDIFFNDTLELVGKLHKNQWDVALSSMDCELIAYTFSVSDLKH